jgi:aryl-alcohol dehydrogenase-like predicted oxidoreductase
MEYRPFGRAGFQVSLLGLGAAEIGHEGASVATVRSIIDEALDGGLNLIDSAAAYGTSEELLGEVLDGRRDRVRLFTKAGYEAGYRPAYSAKAFRESCERSLKRLRTDYLDLLQIHSCPLEDLEKGEIIEEMERLKGEGKVRLIGYSGDREAAMWAVRSGRFDSLQTSFSIFDQEAATTTIPLAVEKGMGVIIKRPLGNGVWRFTDLPENGYYHGYWRRMKALNYEHLREGGPEEAARVALGFVASTPGISTIITGTSRQGRWSANKALLEGQPTGPEIFESLRTRWAELALDERGQLRAEWRGEQ